MDPEQGNCLPCVRRRTPERCPDSSRDREAVASPSPPVGGRFHCEILHSEASFLFFIFVVILNNMPQAKCHICKKLFYAKPHWLKKGWGKYCSIGCSRQGSKKGHFVDCFICNKSIYRTRESLGHSKSKKYFCSKSHQTLWRNQFFKGDRHPNWRHGENIKHKGLLIYNHIEPLCKLCATKDLRVLAVHHLDQDRKNNEITNLVWLCQNCHHLTHYHDVKLK